MLPPLIPRHVLFGNPEKAQPAISPDGKLLAYLAPDEGVLNVWVRTIGRQDDRPVTADRKRGIHSYFWQQDSKHILYDQDRDGDENWHVYQTELQGRTTRDLTPYAGVQAVIVASDPDYPDELLVSMNKRDPQLHDVYRVGLKSGHVEPDTENPGDVAGWGVDNHMRVRIAGVSLPDGGTEVRIRDAADQPWRVFRRWGPEDTGDVAGFSPDDSKVWLISSVGFNAARLLEVDLASDQSREIAADPQYDVAALLTHPTRRHLEAVRFVRERREWQVVDPAIQPDFDALRQVRDGDFGIVSRDLADRTWIVAYVVDDGPVYYYSYERASRQGTLLFSNQPALEQYKLATMQPISFHARDGMKIYGYLTLPAGVAPKGLPMVLLVHGGPWARDVWGLDPVVQWLANRGYAVLQINFRGSTGYGKAYLNAGNREWGAKMHDDLLDGKDWAVQQGYADPNKVAIMGGSYGGYATLVGLAFTPDAFACGVDIVGPSNIVTLIKTIPPYWAPLRSQFDVRVGNVDSEVEFLESRSPLFKADRIQAPLLIGQGANDPRVKQAESDQIVAAMRHNHKPVEYLVFPDEGHGFARPENNLKFFAAAEQFLAQYLGGRAEPPAPEEDVAELRR